MIWFSGTSTLCVYDLNTNTNTVIEQALPDFGPNMAGIAMRCVAKNRGSQIFISFIFDGDYNIAYYETGIEADNHLLNDILPRCKTKSETNF